MALEVEDGTGKANANAFVSLEEANLYHANAGNEAWEDEDEDARMGAIVRATFGLQTKFNGLWFGQKAVAAQRLAWPRSQVLGEDKPIIDLDGVPIPVTVVPQAVKDATCEVALIELTTRYAPVVRNRDDYLKRKKTDVLEREWFAAVQEVGVRFPMIDRMLAALCMAGADSGIGAFNIVLGMTEDELTQHDLEDIGYLSDSRYFEST